MLLHAKCYFIIKRTFQNEDNFMIFVFKKGQKHAEYACFETERNH